MQPKILGIIIVGLVIIVGGYFLLFRGGYQSPTTAPTPGPTGTPAPTQVPVSEVKEINVVGTEFSFNPSSISVKAGEKVKIIFKNNGGAPHNLMVEGLNVGTKTISGGQQDMIEFTVPSSGTYTFFCSVPGHRVSGMEGDLKIE